MVQAFYGEGHRRGFVSDIPRVHNGTAKGNWSALSDRSLQKVRASNLRHAAKEAVGDLRRCPTDQATCSHSRSETHSSREQLHQHNRHLLVVCHTWHDLKCTGDPVTKLDSAINRIPKPQAKRLSSTLELTSVQVGLALLTFSRNEVRAFLSSLLNLPTPKFNGYEISAAVSLPFLPRVRTFDIHGERKHGDVASNQQLVFYRSLTRDDFPPADELDDWAFKYFQEIANISDVSECGAKRNTVTISIDHYQIQVH